MRFRSPLRLLALAAAGALVLGGPATAAPERSGAHGGVRFLGTQVIPHGVTFEGTTVGGISGIDRDPRTGQWVMISDDRSDRQPARFYTAAVEVGAAGVGAVRLTGVRSFLRRDGAVYPPSAAGDGTTVDPETIRVDPWTGRYWWGQEGNRPRTAPTPTDPLIQPSLRQATRDGRFAGELPLPANYGFTAGERGPRRNLALEATTFTADGTHLVSAVESPLLEDGPVPTPEAGGTSRFTVHTRTGRVAAQYAYPQEPLFAAPVPAGSWADSGISEILARDRHRFLVLERGYADGSGYDVRLFEADTRGATDVRDVPSLSGAAVVPMRKRLLVDFRDLPLPRIDNYEGLAWGPRLPGGQRVLLVVSDDNFRIEESTRFVALALP